MQQNSFLVLSKLILDRATNSMGSVTQSIFTLKHPITNCVRSMKSTNGTQQLNIKPEYLTRRKNRTRIIFFIPSWNQQRLNDSNIQLASCILPVVILRSQTNQIVNQKSGSLDHDILFISTHTQISLKPTLRILRSKICSASTQIVIVQKYACNNAQISVEIRGISTIIPSKKIITVEVSVYRCCTSI